MKRDLLDSDRNPKKTIAAAEALAARLPPLLADARRVASVLLGGHGRRTAGAGENFWQFRAYAPSDPVRSIDWKKSAQGDRVFVREKEWDAAQSFLMWCDRSGSMDYRSSKHLPAKRDFADVLFLALASTLFDSGERLLLAGSGLGAFRGGNALLDFAEAATGSAWPLAVSGAFPLRARALLVSDFLFPLEDLGRYLEHLSSRQGGGDIVQILDPAETAFPFSGHVRFEGLEKEDPLLVPEAGSLRDLYFDKMAQHAAELEALCLKNNCRLHRFTTDMPPEKALLELYRAMEG